MALSNRKLAVGILAGVAVLVLSGLVISQVRAAKEREQELERKRASERAALDERIALRRSNEAALALLAAGSVPIWDEAQARMRAVAASDPSTLKEYPELCTPFERLKSRPTPSDPFLAKDVEVELDRELHKCFKDIQERAAKLPNIAIAWCTFSGGIGYSFTSHKFLAQLYKCERDEALGLQIEWFGTPAELRLSGTDNGGVMQGKAFELPMEESRARPLSARFARGPRVEVAFEPGTFYFLGGHRSGNWGRAIAWRIMTADDVMIDWTPYGTDAEGNQAKPNVRTILP
jgi:hypothetical protein